MIDVVLFDDGAGGLGPVCDLRASFDARTGALTQRERVARSPLACLMGVVVPDRLVGLYSELGPGSPVNRGKTAGATLWINGALTCARDGDRGLWALVEALRDRTIGEGDGVLVGDRLAWGVVGGGVEVGRPGLAQVRDGIRTPGVPADVLLLGKPWDVRRGLGDALAADVAEIAKTDFPPMPEGAMSVGGYPLAIDPSARVYPGVVFDREHGGVVIDEHAVVRPGAVLTGPVYIGPNSVVMDRAVIRPNTSVGPWCKVAGEVSATVFQGFANKAHDGFIGDSYVGQWANLGAGTTGSNLLNTYGIVKCAVEADAGPEPTGLQFFGSVIGDHVKTSIGTRLMTGSIIGTGSMWAGADAVKGSVGRFRWVTDAGESPFRIEKFLEVARVVMRRRGVEMGEEYERVLRRLAGAE